MNCLIIGERKPRESCGYNGWLIISLFLFSLLLVAPLAAEPLIPLQVTKGANLINITKTYCTSEYHWKEIARLNGLQEPYVIYPGDNVFVPLSLLKNEKISARIASVRGGVYAIKNKTTIEPLKKGDSLYPGQTLVTEEDGFAHLVFPDQKYTRVTSNSKFTLTYFIKLADDSLKAEFFLEKGRIIHSVKKQLRKKDTFWTRTPVSVTGVRGTEFRLKMSEGESNIVESLDGIVTVDASGESLVVERGKGVKVVEGEKPEKPRDLPPIPNIPQLEEVYKTLPVVITAPAIEDISMLRIRVATDILGQNTVLEQLSPPGKPFVLLALTDASYYCFFTAIDKAGFESLPAGPFVLVVRTIPSAPLLAEPFDGKSVFSDVLEVKWLGVENAVTYHLQLARDEEFTEIVDDRIQEKSVYTTKSLVPGKYFFRVRSIAEDGFTSLYSLPDSWKVEAQPLLGTLEGSTDDGINLRWATMGEGISYNVQIAADTKFSRLVVDEEGVMDSSLSLSVTLEPGQYYVRIRGVLPDGQESPWTPFQVLKVDSPPFGLLDGVILGVFLTVIILL